MSVSCICLLYVVLLNFLPKYDSILIKFQTFQYYAHREKLRHVGRENDLEAMNVAALKMAREVADKHGCLMAGNICNSTVFRADVPETHKETEDIFKVDDLYACT